MIRRRFRDLQPQPMTIVLDRTVKARIDQVLAEKNIARDSFINRVMFFLVARKDHLIPNRAEADSRGFPTRSEM